MNETERIRLLAVTFVMTFLGTLAVTLRVISRAVLIRNSGWDDWTMCIGWLFAVGYAIEALIAVWSLGIGYSSKDVRPDQAVGILKNSLAIEVTYYGCVNFIKISVLFFYLRIAASHFFIMACRATIAFLATFYCISVIVSLAQCMPLKLAWDITGTVAGHCINTTAFFYSTSSIHIALDLWIIALPVKSLMRIQRAQREKLALFIIFGVGVFSVVASIVRLYSIRIFTQSTDPVRDAIPVNLWSIVEVNVGIICASVPALKPLFSTAQRDRTTRAAGLSGSVSSNFQGRYHYGSNKSGVSNNTNSIPGTPSEPTLSSSFSAGVGRGSKSSSTANTYNMKSLSTAVRSLGGGSNACLSGGGVGGGMNHNKESLSGANNESTDNILRPSDEVVYQAEFGGHSAHVMGDSKV